MSRFCGAVSLVTLQRLKSLWKFAYDSLSRAECTFVDMKLGNQARSNETIATQKGRPNTPPQTRSPPRAGFSLADLQCTRPIGERTNFSVGNNTRLLMESSFQQKLQIRSKRD